MWNKSAASSFCLRIKNSERMSYEESKFFLSTFADISHKIMKVNVGILSKDSDYIPKNPKNLTLLITLKTDI